MAFVDLCHSRSGHCPAWRTSHAFSPNTIEPTRAAPVVFGFSQFGMHGILNNRKLRSLYNPGLAAVVLGHIPLGIWYLVEVYNQQMISAWDWLFALFYIGFFMGVVMLRIGYGVLSPRDSTHPFDPTELNRWDRERRLQHAGITPDPH